MREPILPSQIAYRHPLPTGASSARQKMQYLLLWRSEAGLLIARGVLAGALPFLLQVTDAIVLTIHPVGMYAPVVSLKVFG